jgi:2-desacetyl-2-hydroxyethyl bacteriochlorophyllide A dehydrogenase
MKATALICSAKQEFSIQPVNLPEPAPNQIAIRSMYSGVSIGTEFALVRNKISWGPYPLCTGYMGSGVVATVGSAVTNFMVGDRVYYRCNDAMELAGGQKVSCVSGAHCSHAVLDPNTSHGAAHVIPGAGMDVAAMFVMPAVGLFGVDMANPRMGQKVVIHGVGLIGLGVVAACVHRGCEVIAVDISPRQLEMAKAFGADHLINGAQQNLAAEVRKIAPDGADAVFECTGLPQCINPAIALCRRDGSFIWQGNYGNAPVQMDFQASHGRRLRMFFPCDDGLEPCRRAVVRNMALGALKWDKTITHRVNAADAPGLFDRINKGDQDIVGALVRWSLE